ncbi:unnamed protein product [Meloidogyne enterolobii]|uniref:Uncharacterized protein n=1 Tax=Meloidogyne enterolobii TaxID=390850 RepID=A0ACB1AF57_MELEN
MSSSNYQSRLPFYITPMFPSHYSCSSRTTFAFFLLHLPYLRHTLPILALNRNFKILRTLKHLTSYSSFLFKIIHQISYINVQQKIFSKINKKKWPSHHY